MCYTGVAGGWGLAPRSAGLGAQGTLVDRYLGPCILVALAAPLGSIGRAVRRSAAPQGGAPDSLHPPSPDRIRGTGHRRRSRRVPQGPRLAQALRHPAAAAGRPAARRARRLAGQGQAARLMPCASAAGAVQSPSASSPRERLTTIDCVPPQVSRLGGFSAPRSPPRMGRRRALALGSRGVLPVSLNFLV